MDERIGLIRKGDLVRHINGATGVVVSVGGEPDWDGDYRLSVQYDGFQIPWSLRTVCEIRRKGVVIWPPNQLALF